MQKAYFILFLWLTACNVASPEFLVQGMNLKSAIHSLAEIQKKEEPDTLAHYVAHLRSNHAPGFAWDQYWKEIQNQNLHHKMTNQELSTLFSLNDISCRPENLDSFASLLIEIAKSDSQKVRLIRPELKRLRQTCSTTLADSAFKSLVWFLSRKRAEAESAQIQQDRQNALTSPLFPQSSPKSTKSAPTQSPVQNTDGESPLHEHKKTQTAQKSAPTKKYIYTEELQGILLEEWSLNPKKRAWSDILSVVDRHFWSDIRWINWQNGNTEYLKNTLQMEWSTYQSLSHPEQDILWLFKNKNKMADLLALFEYEKYLTVSGALNWTSLVQNLSTQYPEHPQNGNVRVFISLFSRSCQAKDFPPFSQLLKQWNIAELPDTGFCFHNTVARQSQPHAQTESDSPSKEDIHQVFSHLSLMNSALYLLSLYEREKHLRPISEWESFLSSFSEAEWLQIMHLFRTRNDRQNITRLLDLHGRVYRGHIPFLAKDIVAVMRSEEESIDDMTTKGYSLPYMNHPHTLEAFWKQVKATPKKEQPQTQAPRPNSPLRCSYSYVKDMYQFFSEFGKEDMLLRQFRFGQCENFAIEFRKKEWPKLVYQFRLQTQFQANTGHASQGEPLFMPDNQLVWWMGRVLSLPHSLPLSTQASQEEGDDWMGQVWDSSYMDWISDKLFVQEAVSEMHPHEWQRFFKIMIDSLKTPESQTNPYLFQYVSYLSRVVYPLAPQQAICRFFAQEESHLIVQEYASHFIWDLFLQVDWSHLSLEGRGKQVKAVCSGLVSPQRVNTLLFVLSKGIFNNLSAENVPVDIYAEQVRRQADHLISLFERVRAFDRQTTHDLNLNRRLSNLRTIYTGDEYDFEKGYISDQALIFYFSGLILEKLKQATKSYQVLKDMVTHYQETGPHHQNPFDSMHRKYLQSFLTQANVALGASSAIRTGFGLHPRGAGEGTSEVCPPHQAHLHAGETGEYHWKNPLKKSSHLHTGETWDAPLEVCSPIITKLKNTKIVPKTTETNFDQGSQT